MHHQKKIRVFRFVYYLIIFNIGGHDGSVFGRKSFVTSRKGKIGTRARQ